MNDSAASSSRFLTALTRSSPPFSRPSITAYCNSLSSFEIHFSTFFWIFVYVPRISKHIIDCVATIYANPRIQSEKSSPSMVIEHYTSPKIALNPSITVLPKGLTSPQLTSSIFPLSDNNIRFELY